MRKVGWILIGVVVAALVIAALMSENPERGNDGTR
jgi:hypothetical protein